METFQTIRAVICATEETRKYLWFLFVLHTLLINQLLEKLPEQPEFADWRRLGRIPKKAIVAVYKEVGEEDLSFEGLPSRVYDSAVSSVAYTFASIFAIQNKLRLRSEGKQRWLEVQEQDLALAQTTDFSPELVRKTAAQILEDAEAKRKESIEDSGLATTTNSDLGVLAGETVQPLEKVKTKSKSKNKQSKKKKKKENKTQDQPSIMTVLFEFWSESEDPLRSRAIAHLLRNDCKVNPEAEDPEQLALRLSKKQIQIERLQEQLDSQLPIGRDPLGDRTEQFIEDAIAFADHFAFLPTQFWLKWFQLLLDTYPQDSIKLDLWFLSWAYYRMALS